LAAWPGVNCSSDCALCEDGVEDNLIATVASSVGNRLVSGVSYTT
jgi:hypothetical protein